MVKAYLRYEPQDAFGVIAFGNSNIAYDSSGKRLLAPALESVGVWNVRQGDCIKTLTPSPSFPGPPLAVTAIAVSPSLVASGYANGSIRVWDCEKGTCDTTLNGHKGSVSALRYNKTGSLLASGSKDCDVILWDVVAETGLFRLRGHRDQVTDLVFLELDKKLVSSSKDKFMRVWDLETQHCMQIVSGHRSEIWSIDTDPDERYLVTGSADLELRFYTIKHDLISRQSMPDVDGVEIIKSGDSNVQKKHEVLKHFGEIQRQSKHRVATVRFNKFGNLLACQVAGKIVEIFQVLDETESKRKTKRRLTRKEGKTSKREAVEVTKDGHVFNGAGEESNIPIAVPDVFRLLQTIRSGSKICSISFCPITSKNSLATIAASLSDNILEVHSIESNSATKTHSIVLQGHRSVIRSVTLSSDDKLLMSTSHNVVKIWNPTTGSSLCTIDSNFGLCGLLGPYNKYAFVGTKSGKIEIIDLGSGTSIKAEDQQSHHSKDISSIALIPDGTGFVTGSLDNSIVFWEFGNIKKPGQVSEKDIMSKVRKKDMENGVLAVSVSPDARYIAVALLDSTVKVLYMDSLKLFLSLYGHKLPALCMDISSDGDLIVTGSLDKNLKIWGLDFGDCHKSIFAHADSVKAVKFVRNTHYMFSVGNDRLVKYWDADKFELLLTLEGHHGPVSCLAVSSRGNFIVTGSDDRSIRRWIRTEEPFFIEEEKEKRLEEKFESDLDNAFENNYAPKEEVPEDGAVALAGRKTQETLTATDTIIDALDIAEAELTKIAEHMRKYGEMPSSVTDVKTWYLETNDQNHEEKTKGKVAAFQPNIFMNGLSPSEYVLRALSNVHTNNLEQTLLALPFSDALKLMAYLKDWTCIPDKIELACRVSTVLLQFHHNQLISTLAARPVLIVLKDILRSKVKECKDTIGFNLAAMDHMKQLLAMKSDAPFEDAKAKLQEIRSRLSKRVGAPGANEETPRKKKKQKKSSDTHAWI